MLFSSLGQQHTTLSFLTLMSFLEACPCHLYTAPMWAFLLGTMYPPCSTTLFLNQLHLSIPSTTFFLSFICFLVIQLKSLCWLPFVCWDKIPWSRRKSLWFQCIWLGGMATRSKRSSQRRKLKITSLTISMTQSKQPGRWVKMWPLRAHLQGCAPSRKPAPSYTLPRKNHQLGNKCWNSLAFGGHSPSNHHIPLASPICLQSYHKAKCSEITFKSPHSFEHFNTVYKFKSKASLTIIA